MPSKKLSSLSIFFPAYNDEHTIEPLTLSCLEIAKEIADDYEVLIINDHSPDKTGQIADRLAAQFDKVRVIHHDTNKGVGQTMIDGFAQATKDYVFYTDGDAQYDIKELRSFVEHASHYDLIIGYRLKRAEGFKRVFTSQCFRLLIFMTFGLRYRDIDCSFKLLHRRFLEKIRFRTKSALVDPEILIQANRLKISVKEIGVHHYPRQFGASQCLKIKLVLSMISDVLRLRFVYWFAK